jgi:hypothetical protein
MYPSTYNIYSEYGYNNNIWVLLYSIIWVPHVPEYLYNIYSDYGYNNNIWVLGTAVQY